MRKYNIFLALANLLFALNFSFFVSVLERKALTLSGIFALQNLLLLVYSTAWFTVVWARGDKQRIAGRDLVAIASIAALSSYGWSLAMLEGVALTSPLDGATLALVGPSLTLIFAHFMRRRRLTRVRLLGVAISLVGVVIMVCARSWAPLRAGGAWGVGLLGLSVVVAALNTLLFKPQLERYGVMRVALIYAIVAAFSSLALFWGDVASSRIFGDNVAEATEVVLLLTIGGALPLFMLFEGSEYLSPLHTSLYRYLQPFVTMVVVTLRGQARPSVAAYVALATFIVGALLLARGVDRAE